MTLRKVSICPILSCQGLRQAGGGPGHVRGAPLPQGWAGGQLLGDHWPAEVELERQDLRRTKPGDKLVRTIQNKHCEILVRCSDKERNCIQAHVTACKLMKLHVSSWNCMQAHETSCKLMELHVSSGDCMQAHGPSCKLM